MSIALVLGRNGYGKDACVQAHFVLPAFALGRRVVSNIELYPEEVGYPRDLYVPLGDAEETLPRIGRHVRRLCAVCGRRARFEYCRNEACEGYGLPTAVDVPRVHPNGKELWSVTNNEGCGLYISEVTTEFPSRGTLNVPPSLQAITKQFRKPDIAPVVMSDTSYARVDLLLREVATLVIEAYPFMPLGFKVFSDKPATPFGWWRHRAYEHVFYDGEAYERADRTGQWGDVQPLKVKRVWRKKQVARIHAVYDSQAGVDLADRIACKECGGDFRRSACKDPLGHRQHTRDHRDDRETAAYPITAEVLERAGFYPEAEAVDAGLVESELVTDAA